MSAWLPFMIGLIIFETLADVGAKQFEHTSSRRWYTGALLAYVIGNAIRLFAMKKGVGLGRGTIIFSVMTTILALIIGYFIYQEPIKPMAAIGIVCCVIGLVLIEL